MSSFEPVHNAFQRLSSQHPEAIAVRSAETSVTYGGLAKKVHLVTIGLQTRGVGKGCRVVVLLNRSADLVVTILSVLKAGGVFIPLDPTHPPHRNLFIMKRAGLSLIITEPQLSETWGCYEDMCCSVGDLITVHSDCCHAVAIDPLDPAYIIYTSGTTGDPKGVVIPHRSLNNYICWAQDTYVKDEPPILPLYSSVAVDMTLTSLFLPLVSGGEVVLYPSESSMQALFDVCDDDRVNTLKLTPSQLWLYLARPRLSHRLHCLIVGGEILPKKLALKAIEQLGQDLVLINEYGPTEATVGCVAHTFDPHEDTDEMVPIGRPITGMQAYVLDKELAPVKEGKRGEICLVGDSLAVGYLGAPTLTRHRFVRNPLAPAEIMYRTGDVGQVLPSGNLTFLGRCDGQVKFNGYRIELEGLRSLIGRHPQVEDSMVLLQETSDGMSALVAYVVAHEGTTTSELRQLLEKLIPLENVPQHFVILPRLPIGVGGKLDKNALPSLNAILDQRDELLNDVVPPRNPVEEKMIAIWCEALGLANVGVKDDFFELGGHSLLAHTIIVRIRETFNVDLNMRSIAENRTISAIAHQVTKAQDQAPVNTVTKPGLDVNTVVQPIGVDVSSGQQSDEENLVLAESAVAVDRVVGDFYSRFPWPWNSSKFEMPADPDFEITLINQELGDLGHTILSTAPSIWVAGCGTNQALMSALRFPKAQVLGTDLSTSSLDICKHNASEVGVENLTLSCESINDATYKESFDFIICTGVIHHTFDPSQSLASLARALKRDGVIELLVYNRFHRTITSAFQKSVRLLTRDLGTDDLAIAKHLASGLSVDNRLSEFVARHRDWEESDFADLLINPVEHSFTVDSLAAMADKCGLELVRPCTSLYAKFRAETLDWEMSFDDPELQRVYNAMPDTDRWRVSNLLLHEKSPMLWFYLRRKDAIWHRKTEQELAQEMLETHFVKARTQQKVFLRDKDGVFQASSRPLEYPAAAPDASVLSIYEQFELDRPRLMADVLAELELPTTFEALHAIRQKLMIPAFPYLQAVPERN